MKHIQYLSWTEKSRKISYSNFQNMHKWLMIVSNQERIISKFRIFRQQRCSIHFMFDLFFVNFILFFEVVCRLRCRFNKKGTEYYSAAVRLNARNWKIRTVLRSVGICGRLFKTVRHQLTRILDIKKKNLNKILHDCCVHSKTN